MIPFNKERALAGDPVITRDGREVKQITWFEDAERWVGVIDSSIYCWRENGSNTLFEKYDLFMKLKTRTMTVWAWGDNPYLYKGLPPHREIAVKRITSATVNPDGSVTVEVEE